MDLEEKSANNRSTVLRDLKRESRRNVVFALYLTGSYTQESIGNMLGINRTTVWEDLKWCEENNILATLNPEDTLKAALMQLQIDRMKLIQESDDVRDFLAKHPSLEEVSPTQRANLHKVVADLIKEAAFINIKILERYTQTTNISGSSKGDQRAKDTLQFFTSRFGPDCLIGYKEYMQAADMGRRLDVEAWKAVPPKQGD